MSYNKLVSLLAVSTLALGACSTDDTEEVETDGTEEVEETDETEEVEEAEEGSSKDLIEQAKGETGDAFPDYGLEVVGTWTQDGYVIGHPEGEAATVPVNILTENEDYNVYLLEDGMVAEVVSNEEQVEFLVEDPSDEVDYHVGISPDDLGSEGEEVSEEDFARSEKVIFEIAEEEAEEE